MFNLVIFGPPGAGKGTQSERIIDKYSLTHLSTGDLFRKHLGEGTELGKLAQGYMDNGNLVPDEVVIKMVDDKISNTPDTNGFIFDGFPRTVPQAEALDELLAAKGEKINCVISLEVEEEELWARIRERGKTSGRADDQDKSKFDTRIAAYKSETVPVLEYYNRADLVAGIHGIGSIDEIFSSIVEAVDKTR